MTREIAFAIMIMLAVVFYLAGLNAAANAKAPWLGGASGLCAFLALVVLGWSVYGELIHK